MNGNQPFSGYALHPWRMFGGDFKTIPSEIRPMIAVIDCGGQYTHLIWRTVRDLDYDVRIFPFTAKLDEVRGAKAFILSGGPGSVTRDELGVAREIVRRAKGGELAQPLLGICLGHQLLAHEWGGRVEKGASAEYGITKIIVDEPDQLFKGLPRSFNAWVSHFDEVKELPGEFVPLAHSRTCRVEAMRHESMEIFGVQFHPEVWHTENGERIIANFLLLSKA